MAALSDFEPNDYTKPAFLEQVTLSCQNQDHDRRKAKKKYRI